MSVYPASMMAEANTMRAGGWRPHQIHRVLVDRYGVAAPSLRTVQLWTNPGERERDNARRRRAVVRRSAERGTFRLHSDQPEYLAAFAIALRGEGVPATSVAKTLTVVTGDRWTRDRVDTLLKDAA